MSDHSRRKRKDTQSRDFVCLCGKSYLSYPAAYIHVKNKHQGDKKYYQGITKPNRQNITRGRPKQKKLETNNIQTKALSIIEQSILEIYQKIKHNSSRDKQIVLQANESIQQLDLKAQYDKINQNSNLTNIFQLENQTKQQQNKQLIDQLITFQQAINKHFSVSIAAQIRYYLNHIYQINKNTQRNSIQQINFNNKPKIFNDNQIYTIINNTFQKWIKINGELA